MIRKIIEINEELCNGCGACAKACHEGAIAMVQGKAKLIKDDYCDGLGNCLPACPTNAISIIEREAADFDEEAVKERMESLLAERMDHKVTPVQHTPVQHMCPGAMARALKSGKEDTNTKNYDRNASEDVTKNNRDEVQKSNLMQWPVQIKLVPIHAPYFENANLLIAADCTAYAYANFHKDFMKNHITIIGCPKLDDTDYSEKLTEIIKRNNIKSVKIVRMEVPCCGGIEHMTVTALRNSGKMIPWQVITITCNGDIRE